MHVGVMWAHASSAKEADFLFPDSGGKGKKRRRGEAQPMQLGAPVCMLLAHVKSCTVVSI